jgi:hypothetical protein
MHLFNGSRFLKSRERREKIRLITRTRSLGMSDMLQMRPNSKQKRPEGEFQFALLQEQEALGCLKSSPYYLHEQGALGCLKSVSTCI